MIMVLTCHHFASDIVGAHERSFDVPLQLVSCSCLRSEIQDDCQRNK